MSRHVLCCGALLLAIAVPGRAGLIQYQLKRDQGGSGSSSSSPPRTQTPPPMSKPPPGYHDMTINQGGHKMVVRVADQAKPSSVNSEPTDGHYNPERMDFNKPSTYANKSFFAGNDPRSKDDAATEGNKHFATSPYSTGTYNQADHTFQTAAYKSQSKSNSEFAKSYTLPTHTAPDADRSFAVKASDYQDKNALIAQTKPKVSPFAAPGELSDKKFFDPVMTHLKQDHYNLDVSRLTNLPNRTLTIDEVRDLINHEQIPDLNSKPEAPSKPLNDPGWEPPEKLPMLNDKAAPATPPPDETKDGELPSPGMMAKPPGNNQQLPK